MNKIKHPIAYQLFTSMFLLVLYLIMLIIQLDGGSGNFFVVYVFGMFAVAVSFLFLSKRRIVESRTSGDRYSSSISLIIQYVSAILIYGCTMFWNAGQDPIGEVFGFFLMVVTSLVFTLDLTKEEGHIKPFFEAKNNASRR